MTDRQARFPRGVQYYMYIRNPSERLGARARIVGSEGSQLAGFLIAEAPRKSHREAYAQYTDAYNKVGTSASEPGCTNSRVMLVDWLPLVSVSQYSLARNAVLLSLAKKVLHRPDFDGNDIKKRLHCQNGSHA